MIVICLSSNKSTKNTVYPVWLQLARDSKEDFFKKTNQYFTISPLSFLWKRMGPLIWRKKNSNHLYSESYVPSLVKIGPDFLKKKISKCCKFANTKKLGSSFYQTWILSSSDCIVKSLFECDRVVQSLIWMSTRHKSTWWTLTYVFDYLYFWMNC